MLRYLQMTDPDLAPPKKYPNLAALSEHCESLPEFQATYPPDIVYPRGE
jgi:glutathione S-transferase